MACENGFPGSKYIDLEDPLYFFNALPRPTHRPTATVWRVAELAKKSGVLYVS